MLKAARARDEIDDGRDEDRAAIGPFGHIRDLRLAELLGALSHALDLTEGHPAGHGIRCCWVGVHLGRALGLGATELSDLYYTLLLKDLGCSSNAARIRALYLTDDLSFKRDYRRLDGSRSQALRFLLSRTGPKAGPVERLGAIVGALRHGGRFARELVETRCQRGAQIARRMRFSEAVAQGIRALDEHWDGSGRPEGLAGAAIPLAARIALVAQVADVFFMAEGPDAAVREVRRRAGTWFDPALAAAFAQVAGDAAFWAALAADDLQARVLALAPGQSRAVVDDDDLDDIAAAFAQVIDAKSPFTAGHSERVSLYVDLIAAQLGLSGAHRRWLKRAALLHDIGKLGVSNAVLEKPGALDDPEWAAMKQHPAASEAILGRIAAFAGMARVCGAHHERLDGTGYPRGLKGAEIGLDTRILTTADIFDALTAARPYRDAVPPETALRIMANMVGTAIDGRCFAALKRALERS